MLYFGSPWGNIEAILRVSQETGGTDLIPMRTFMAHITSPWLFESEFMPPLSARLPSQGNALRLLLAQFPRHALLDYRGRRGLVRGLEIPRIAERGCPAAVVLIV